MIKIAKSINLTGLTLCLAILSTSCSQFNYKNPTQDKVSNVSYAETWNRLPASDGGDSFEKDYLMLGDSACIKYAEKVSKYTDSKASELSEDVGCHFKYEVKLSDGSIDEREFKATRFLINKSISNKMITEMSGAPIVGIFIAAGGVVLRSVMAPINYFPKKNIFKECEAAFKQSEENSCKN